VLERFTRKEKTYTESLGQPRRFDERSWANDGIEVNRLMSYGFHE
jgi:hypothetical protein